MSSSRGQMSSRIPALDGLRGLAIFIVVFGHYAVFKPDQGWAATIIRTVFPLSWTGVDLFFVLSGFLIGGILMDCRGAENYFKTFYVRRICRIFPLYFVCVALFFILPWLLSNYRHQIWYGLLFGEDFSKLPRWSFVVFLQNFFYAKTFLAGSLWMASTWSLAVEEQFYLLLPIAIWVLPARKLSYVLALLILFVPVFRLFLYMYHPKIYPHVLLPCRADALLIGVLCAYWIRHEGSRNWIGKNQRSLRQILGLLLVGVICLTVYANSPYSFEMVFLGYSWMALFYACLLLIVVTSERGIIVRCMHFPPLRNLGVIAYGVYLMHIAINILMHDLILGKEIPIANLSDGAVTLAAFLTTLLLATLSWRFFEKPIVGWGHSFSYTNKKILPAK
jgi:peptidoglycan/LPS O-acetylase OafA/YrhL